MNSYVGVFKSYITKTSTVVHTEITAMLRDERHCEGAVGKGDQLVFYTEQSLD